jgi:hypothetical protein
VNLVLALQILTPVIYLIALLITIRSNRRLIKAMEGAHETAEVAMDLLDQMEQAHDPGRDAHERFARALETGMIRPPGTDDRPDPAARRAAAMAMAADMIGVMRRANLVMVDASPEDGE